VTGGARAVADQDRLTRYERLLRPWVDEPMNYIIAIDCDLVSGYELVAPAW